MWDSTCAGSAAAYSPLVGDAAEQALLKSVRAEKLIHRLRRDNHVTVAFEAVHTDKQPVLDQFTSGSIELNDIPELTNWGEYWGIPWQAYQGVFATGELGVDLIAIGQGSRSGPRRSLIGSVAARVVEYAPCPVLVVKPPPGS